MNHSETLCPTCGATVPVHAGYVSWCDCGWNLSPHQAETKDGAIDRIRLKLGNRMAQDLFTKVSASESIAPAFNRSKLLAGILAAIVHLTTLLFVVLGVVLMVEFWPNIFAVAGGLLALCIAWVLRPRFRKKPENVLPREEFPALYRLIDELATTLGLDRVEGIVLTTDFNAMFTQIGLRRRPYIIIGLPLFAILTSEERVALLGHEVAHGVNGDVTRSIFIGSAIDTLVRWYYLLMPDEIFSSESGMPGLVMAPMNLLLAGLAKVAYGMAYLQFYLVMRDSQRAEYLADYLATTASGTPAMLSMLDKLHYGSTYTYALQRTALNRDAGGLFEQLASVMTSTPEREVERIRRIGCMQGSRLDTTHPPTVYRRRLLEARPVSQPGVPVSAEHAAAIERELKRCYGEAHQRALDEYRNALYY